MRKVCCVEDANICPKSPSCSMVLRSACSHKHSRESSTVKEYLHSSSSHKRKHTSLIKTDTSLNGNVHIEPSLESSLQQIVLKSAPKRYSLLKGHFYDSFEISNVSCTKLNFSRLSDLSSSYMSKNSSHKGCNSSAFESDINSSDIHSTSVMSNTNLNRRSSRSSARSLSDSEEESDITLDSISRPQNILPSKSNTNFITRRSIHSVNNINNAYSSNNNDTTNYISSSHINREMTGSSSGDSVFTNFSESSHLDASSVQYSLFDRFRWFLWRCTYLRIIRCVNLDVWFLSRIHNCGKIKVILFLLLPLLFLIMWSSFQKNSFSRETLSESYTSCKTFLLSFISSIFSLLSSVLSSVYLYIAQEITHFTSDHTAQEDSVTTSELPESPDGECSFPFNFYTLFAVISAWISKARDSAYSTIKYYSVSPTYHENEEINSIYRSEEDSKHHAKKVNDNKNEEMNSFLSSREGMKLIAAELLKDEISSLKQHLKVSIQETEANKEEKDRKLASEIKNLQLEFKSLSETMGKLEQDIRIQQKEKSDSNENAIHLSEKYKSQIDHLNVQLKTIEAKLNVLEHLKSCCDKQLNQEDFKALLEKNIVLAFKSVVDHDTDPNSKYSFFNKWLDSKFFNYEKLMQEINVAVKKQSPSSSYSDNQVNFDNVVRIVESTVQKHVDSIKTNISKLSQSTYSTFTDDLFSEERVKKIVKEAIMMYDADKIGQVDYALESGGGSVLGTRCSETYVEKYGKFSIFGVPLWTNSNSPRTAIQPDVQPGRCWAFKGSQGFLVLELSATIYPTGFTLEHIPVSLSPTGSIDSAPKNFSVWGLDSEKDNKGILLGEYSYDVNEDPLQYFPVEITSEKPYSYIELQIHSNHGNLEYTCLYRFRVHGKRVR